MKRSKIEPAVETLALRLPTGVSFVDISQIASLANRRFYRQGLNWAVSNIKLFKSAPQETGAASVSVSKLPNTWVMSNAWHKGFASWQRMNREALEEAESVRPKFLDFKVYANDEHHAAGFAANLLPQSDIAVTAIPGEWESSKYRIPVGPANPGQTSDREVIAVGASFPGAGASGINAVSLIEGYAASRGLPNVLDPNAPDDADDVVGTTPENWMSALFNDGTEQTQGVLADMIDENNIAPYPFENDGVNIDTMYPGGANQLTGLQVHDATFFNAGTFANVINLKGGNFPCGLMKFGNNTDGIVDVLLQLVPGPHRGYLAMPMQDM